MARVAKTRFSAFHHRECELRVQSVVGTKSKKAKRYRANLGLPSPFHRRDLIEASVQAAVASADANSARRYLRASSGGSIFAGSGIQPPLTPFSTAFGGQIMVVDGHWTVKTGHRCRIRARKWRESSVAILDSYPTLNLASMHRQCPVFARSLRACSGVSDCALSRPSSMRLVKTVRTKRAE
jgi:hypothetical protein